MNLDLTSGQVRVILRALAVCSADAEDARDNCNGDQLRDYYERKRREYDEIFGIIHDATEDKFFRDLDATLLKAML